MKKTKLVLISGFLLLTLCIPFSIFTTVENSRRSESIDTLEINEKLKVSGLSHDPIRINGDSEFTSANGAVKGSGTKADPYVIANWTIDARNSSSCIIILGTSVFFQIRNCSLYNSGDNFYGIALNCGNGTIINLLETMSKKPI